MKIKVEEIVVTERIRQDIGSLELLTDSIQKVGLLNPILVNSEHQLLAGLRRLEACKKLGWTEIDATILDLNGDAVKVLDIELEENKGRLDLVLTDMNEYNERMKEILTPPPQSNVILAFLKKMWARIKSFFASFKLKKNKEQPENKDIHDN